MFDLPKQYDNSIAGALPGTASAGLLARSSVELSHVYFP